jgi:hypothetical protein
MLRAEFVDKIIRAGGSTKRPEKRAKPKFRAGQKVRARNLNPAGHTRLPRYVRGKLGVIHHDHGIFVFPDTNASGSGEKPQHVYSVRFEAKELWGDSSRGAGAIYIDLWDDYLEPASKIGKLKRARK